MSQMNCACGSNCICCTAENLAVTCGCHMEAKQYEYDIEKKIAAYKP